MESQSTEVLLGKIADLEHKRDKADREAGNCYKKIRALEGLLREGLDNDRLILKNGLEPWIAREIESHDRKVEATLGEGATEASND